MIDSNVIWQGERQYHIVGVAKYALYLILGIFIFGFAGLCYLESLYGMVC